MLRAGIEPTVKPHKSFVLPLHHRSSHHRSSLANVCSTYQYKTNDLIRNEIFSLKSEDSSRYHKKPRRSFCEKPLTIYQLKNRREGDNGEGGEDSQK